MTIQAAEPISIRATALCAVVEVKCPYCKRTHEHRVREANDASHRAAPCGKGEYYIRSAPPENDAGEHVLYRFYDADGILLYVGITNNPPNRFSNHRLAAPWWKNAVNVTMSRFPNRRALMAAELTAIRTENPKHNIAGVTTPKPRPRPIRKRSSNSKYGRPIFPAASTFPAPDAIASDDEPEYDPEPQPAIIRLVVGCPACGGRCALEDDSLVRCSNCLNMWIYDEWKELVGIQLPRLQQ